MYKKLLRTFIATLAFFILNTPGNTGFYMDCFERELLNNGMRTVCCNLKHVSERWVKTENVEHVPLGIANGSYWSGSYANPSHPSYLYQDCMVYCPVERCVPESWVCDRCGQTFKKERTGHLQASLTKSDDSNVITLKMPSRPGDSAFNAKHRPAMCDKPLTHNHAILRLWSARNKDGDWRDVIETIWKQARQLDTAVGNTVQTDTAIYQVNMDESTSCWCCHQ